MTGRALATVAAALALGVVPGCGGSDGKDAGGAAPLRWTAAPQVFTTKALPRDRVAFGYVRNTSAKAVVLDAGDLRVIAAGGRPLRTTGQYAAGYAHGLYGAFQKPDPIPPGELSRLGKAVRIPAGKTAPLAVSWSFPAGQATDEPASVDYGPGRLPLPTRVRLGAGL